MEINASRHRILRRRSPPRVIPVFGDLGFDSPTKAIAPILNKKPEQIKSIQPIKPALIEIVSTGESESNEQKSQMKTSVSNFEGHENLPRIQVSRLQSPTLRISTENLRQEKSESARPIQEKVVKLPDVGGGLSNKTLRKERTSQIENRGVIVEPGTRQVWNLSEAYSSKKFDEIPFLTVQGDQATRLTFHRDAGGILQDIELPPLEEPIEIRLPEGTKSFTLEGLGGKLNEIEQRDIGSGVITTQYPIGEFSGVGFQRNTLIHQIGFYRYLTRGAFLQAKESLSQKVMQDQSIFTAGEVLSRIDDLRFYSTSSIKTFVLILKTLPEQPPMVKIAIEGVEANEEPLIIKRKDAVAYIWSLGRKEGFEGPAIIDIVTDETTDVNSAIGYAAQSKVIAKMLYENKWSNLVPIGPLSRHGYSVIKWHHTVDATPEYIPILDKEKINKRVEPQLPKPLPPQKIEPEQPIPPPIEEQVPIQNDLPTIELPEATAMSGYSFDLSQFAGDDDEGDSLQFELVEGPDWVRLTEFGMLSGIPENKHAGLNICQVRVIDSSGLSSDAIVHIDVKEHILNRAPYWKPNISLKNTAKETPYSMPEKIQQNKNQTNQIGQNTNDEHKIQRSQNTNAPDQKDFSQKEFEKQHQTDNVERNSPSRRRRR